MMMMMMMIQSVQQVLSNLLISHIELRTDDSPDIRPYTHERHVEKVVVPLGDELASARDTYLRVSSLFLLLCPPL